jgi:hypothetical protein
MELSKEIHGFIGGAKNKLKQLYCIAIVGTVQNDPNKIIQKWSISWKGKDNTWKQMSTKEREYNFKTFMLEDYKKFDCFE